MIPALAACGHGHRPPGARVGGLLHPQTPPSCTLAPATSPEDRLSPGELRVLVLDPAGQPIPSARVLLAEPARVADSDLRGLVTFAGLPSGGLSWTLDKPGYQAAWSGPVALQAEEGAFATCLLGPTPEALAFGR